MPSNYIKVGGAVYRKVKTAEDVLGTKDGLIDGFGTLGAYLSQEVKQGATLALDQAELFEPIKQLIISLEELIMLMEDHFLQASKQPERAYAHAEDIQLLADELLRFVRKARAHF